ncbi:MAG: DUF1549 domain-containing protein, partial [Planctomycetota bacterium]
MVRCALLSILLAVGDASQARSELRVYPPEISLSGQRDRQSIVVQHVGPEGLTRDVSEEVVLRIADEGVAELSDRVVRGAADGATELLIDYEGRSERIPVSVENVKTAAPVSYQLDVAPVLMRAGCNSGACHGAARGKDGFRLSLFGFDAEGDHFRLTREISGRRINLARPDASLLLRKATGAAPHTGGERFTSDSAYYAMLRQWIVEGAEFDRGEVAQPVGIDVFPELAVLAGEGEQQQLTIRARYSDGSTRDVTDLALYLSNNDNAAKVSDDGMVVAGAAGEAFVMARFATFTEGARFVVFAPGEGPSTVEAPVQNEIDRLVYADLGRLGLQPSELCSDEDFLRRVYVDIQGILPNADEYRQFIEDSYPSKRERLVDELLESDRFIDLWTMKIGELLKIRTTNQVSYKALLGMHRWVRDQIAASAPLDQLVRSLISANGGTFDQPETNFYQMEANTLQLAENVAQSFLGVRIQCAQCHNHPFDRWTMDDYYGFAAFFSQVDFKQSRDPRELIVYNRGQGEIRHPVDDRAVPPKFLGGDEADVSNTDRRAALADWIAAPDNAMFSEHMANVVWAHHFGRGIVEPVDDVRISNPPS